MGIDPYKLQEAKAIDQRLGELLDATDESALTALRKLFVDHLDFNPENRIIPLHRDQPQMSASYIASLDGVRVVAVRLPGRGRVLMRDVQDVLKRAREEVGGDILLAAGAEDGSEWQLVYPSTRGEKEVLRRITLHRGQHHRTVAEQLAAVYRQAHKTGIADALDRAYDVEAVTKKFFGEYKRVFDHAMEEVQGFPDKDERRLFCQTLFNRLMFIYFLQRKGWLRFGGSADYLNALWKDAQGGAENFYEVRLRLLFFAGLNNERTADFDQARKVAEPLIGEVPFLNGGLFAESELDQRPGIHVPDSVIEALLNDLFHKFNFTISESTPYDVQVAVDPEMLGKVFEELVTGRHETGSYYTPRPIVSFMCREALKGYLQTHVPELSDGAAARYVGEHDVSAITREQAGPILEALETITVVDPACGSGAYLLGMMQELLELENLLYNPNLIARSEDTYKSKLRIIEKNVYGVDIDPFAVNTAMLRLWLSLIVDYEGEDDPPPLPNLDFKIACGDSLIGPNPALHQISLDEGELIGALTELKATFLRVTGSEKDAMGRDIDSKIAILKEIGHSEIPESAIAWHFEFAEVFQNGGFDVVVANPPYVRQEGIKDQKPQLRAVFGFHFASTADLYIYFYFRAFQLLRDKGMLVFVSSNKWFRASYGEGLRTYIGAAATVLSVTDFGDLPVFESATAYSMIFVARKGQLPGYSTRYTETTSLEPPYPDVAALVQRDGRNLAFNALKSGKWTLGDTAALELVRRMSSGTIPLQAYVGNQVFRGILTGFNEAFYLTSDQREAMIARDPASAEIIRPLLTGKDVRRWAATFKDRWMIVTKVGIEIDRYPAVFDHLARWEEGLKRRQDQGNHWWELRACAYYQAFDGPKILFPDIAAEPRFALDREGAFGDTTVFIIPVADLYLLGVLNSSAVEQFFSELSPTVRGGYFRFKRQYVFQIPIPVAGPHDRETIAELVRDCMVAQEAGKVTDPFQGEIDARVAALYGLDELAASPSDGHKVTAV
jgi:TaqI-like C-terminal specificity domain/Eco57I restriction-modification methylase